MIIHDGPGNWQQFLKRKDNIGLPLMEVRKKYMLEENSQIASMAAVASSAAAAAAAGAAGGYPVKEGVRLDKFTYALYRKGKFTIPNNGDLNARPFGTKDFTQMSLINRGTFNGRPYYEVQSKTAYRFSNRFLFWNIPNEDANGDPITSVTVGGDNAYNVQGLGWVMYGKLANVFNINSGTINAGAWTLDYSDIIYVPRYSGTNGDNATGKGDYFLGKGYIPSPGAGSTGWKFSSTGFTVEKNFASENPDPIETELPGEIQLVYDIENDNQLPSAQTITATFKLVKSTDNPYGTNNIGQPETYYNNHTAFPAFPVYVRILKFHLPDGTKNTIPAHPGTILYYLDGVWTLANVTGDGDKTPYDIVPEAFIEDVDYTNIAGWQRDPEDSTAVTRFISMTSVTTIDADNNPWGVYIPGQVCFNTLTYTKIAGDTVSNSVWRYGDGVKIGFRYIYYSTAQGSWLDSNSSTDGGVISHTGPQNPNDPWNGDWIGQKGEIRSLSVGTC